MNDVLTSEEWDGLTGAEKSALLDKLEREINEHKSQNVNG